MRAHLLLPLVFVCMPANADLRQAIDAAATDVEENVIVWRRDIHQHPELANRETRTAELVAKHLRALGHRRARPESRTPAWSACCKGGKPGPVVALRADMDALPVTEQIGPAVRVDGEGDVSRAGGRRDARLRARQPRRDAAWARRDGARGYAGASFRVRSSSSSSRPKKGRRRARKAARP